MKLRSATYTIAGMLAGGSSAGTVRVDIPKLPTASTSVIGANVTAPIGIVSACAVLPAPVWSQSVPVACADPPIRCSPPKCREAAADYELGEGFRLGRGRPQDQAKAFELYRRAAATGFAPAEYMIGLGYQYGGVARRKDLAMAASWFATAADQRYIPAQTALALMYTTGSGVPHDLTRTAELLQEAAQEGDTSSQTQVGIFYQVGLGVPQNAAEAMKWYTLAAQGGDKDAQLLLVRSTVTVTAPTKTIRPL